MVDRKALLKFLFALCAWSLVFVGLLDVYRNLTATNQITTFEALIDSRQDTDDELALDEENRISSLPIAYFNKHQDVSQLYSSKCGKYPQITEIEFNNIHWQTFHTTNGTFQLLNAYYDVRKNSLIGPSVRIISMVDRVEPKVEIFCQFWFDGQKKAIISKIFEYKYMWIQGWGKCSYSPHLMTCRIPTQFQKTMPASVSLVEKRCEKATNNLRVIYNRPPGGKKKGFAVCVKGLIFPYDDISVRLVEWIELLGILGVEKIHFHKQHVHPNTSKVLKYYEREGNIELTPLSLAGGQPNMPGLEHLFFKHQITQKRQYEIIAYNDCLYKNMYRYDYIAVLDTDEVILPKKDMTWPELMKRAVPHALKQKNQTYASYKFRNVYFLDVHQLEHGSYEDIPKQFHMLQHVHRSRTFARPGFHEKCFHNPENVMVVHNHFALRCLSGRCPSYTLPTDDAQLQHYRADCKPAGNENCTEFETDYVSDTTIWKYKDELIYRAVKTLQRLGFSQNTVG